MNGHGKILFRAKLKKIRSKIRTRYFRYLGLKIGANSRIGDIKFDWPESIVIGQNCVIEDGVTFWVKNPFSPDNKIIIADNVFIGKNCQFNCSASISIGKNCLIASNTVIADVGHKIGKAELINTQDITVGEVSIGEDVWIGIGCIILKNVILGNGCVIGAGSVVNKSVPEYEIWAGVPSKKIGNRN